MAEGKSNQGTAEALFITPAAVEKHVTSIFHKLQLAPTAGEHRRVLAVLRYLRGTSDAVRAGGPADPGPDSGPRPPARTSP
jgi:DNA-binding NarL/FixJ family response regulator